MKIVIFGLYLPWQLGKKVGDGSTKDNRLLVSMATYLLPWQPKIYGFWGQINLIINQLIIYQRKVRDGYGKCLKVLVSMATNLVPWQQPKRYFESYQMGMDLFLDAVRCISMVFESLIWFL